MISHSFILMSAAPFLFFLICISAATDIEPTQHKFVTLKSGLEMHYVDAGEPSKPAVILLHGWPDFWYTWRFQITELSKSYRVLAPDMRGFGQTDVPFYQGDYHLEYLVQDVVELLEALNIEKAHVIGHDWGSIIAWASAYVHPEKFYSVAGLSVPYMVPMISVEDMERKYGEEFYIVQFQKPGVAEKALSDIKNFFRFMFLAPEQPAKPNQQQEVPTIHRLAFAISAARQHPTVFKAKSFFSESDLELYTKTFKKTGLVGTLNYYRNWNKDGAYINEIASTRNSTYELSIPSLHIMGKQDLEFLHNPIYVHNRYLKNYQLKEVDGGHFFQQEKHQETTKIILEFLEGVGKQSTQQKSEL